MVLVKPVAQTARYRHLRAQGVGGPSGVVALGLAGYRQGLALYRRQQGLHPPVIVAENAAAGLAVCVVDIRAESFVEVQVLARVGAGVEPVFARQVEVACRADIDRASAHLAGDVDTALHVGEVKRAVGIGDLAAHIQVLRAAGRAERPQAAVDAIGLFGEGVLRDANHALATRTGCAQAHLVEVGGAGIERDQRTIEGVDPAGLADADIVDLQAKRGLVLDGDVGLLVGEQAAVAKGFVHGNRRGGIGGDIDQARRGLDGGQAQEQLVKLAARHHGRAFGVGQAHFLELGVDFFEQRLVTGDRLGVSGVAGHPANDLGAVFKQLIGHIGVDQAGQGHVFGLEHVKVVAELTRQLLAPVAGLHLHLLPARAGEVFGGGVDAQGIARAFEPAAVAGAHRGVFVDIDRAVAQADGGRDFCPAAGVGVVLCVEHQVEVGVAARRELIGRARFALAIVGAHQFNNGAGGHRHRDFLHLQSHIVVGLGCVETELRLFSFAQVHPGGTGFLNVTQATGLRRIGSGAADQIGFVADGVGLDAQHRLVVHARLNAGRIAHDHLVAAVERLVANREQPAQEPARAEVEHRAIQRGTRHAFFSQQVDVADGAHLGAAQQRNVVALVDRDRAHRHGDTGQRDHGHVGPRLAQQYVGHPVPVLAGHDLDVTTHQLGIGQRNVVVGLQVHRGRRIGTAKGRHGEGVGTGHHVGIGAGGQHQVAIEVAQRGAFAHADVGDRIGALRGHSHRHPKAGEAVHPHLVDQVDGRERFDAEHPRLRAGDGEIGVGRNVHRGAKALGAAAQVGGVGDRADRAGAGREGLERVLFVAVLVLDRLVGGVNQDGLGVDRRALAHLHVGSTSHQIGDQRAAAGQQTDRQVEGLGVKVLVAVGDHIDQASLDLGVLADAGHRAAHNAQVRQGAGAGDQAAAGGRRLLVDPVIGFGADAQHASLHLGQVAHGRVDGTRIDRADRGHTHRDRQAATDGQRVGAGIGILVGARRNQHRARCFDLGGGDEGINHRRERVARLRARSGCGHHAEAGRCGLDHRVGI